MKAEIRQLLRDVKAATRLGSPGAIDATLDGLLLLPGVAANASLDDNLIDKVLLPIGQELAALPTEQLRPLSGHPLAAGRAIGAVALAHQFLQSKAISAKELGEIAGDRRAEVRLALARSLNASANLAPQALFTLGMTWLRDPAPRLRQAALLCLPALANTVEAEPAGYTIKIIDQLHALDRDEDPDVRAALAYALNALAQAGQADRIIALLTAWSEQEAVNSWVITRALSGGWVIQFPQQAAEILKNVLAKTGTTSEITNAQRALERHGVEINLSRQ